MIQMPVALALIISAAAAFATLGATLPLPPTVAAEALAIPASGCHADIRDHRVPEFGRSARHFHRGANCRAVLVDQRRDGQRRADCHRDARTHRIGGVMLRHRHVGEDCRVRELRGSTAPVPN